MDASTIIAFAIFFLLLSLMGTIGGLLAYLGMFREIVVKVGKPPIRKFRGFYKFARGDYKESGSLYEEVNRLAPGMRTFGVYYDNPEKTAVNNRRYIVGSIVEENGQIAVPEQEQLKEVEQNLRDNGFKEIEFPDVENAVFADFPWRTNFSILIAVNRVYSALNNFIREKGLDCGPFFEVYDRAAEIIHFISPLDKQDEFYVLESFEAANDDDFEDLSPESGNDDEAGEKSDSKEESAEEEE